MPPEPVSAAAPPVTAVPPAVGEGAVGPPWLRTENQQPQPEGAPQSLSPQPQVEGAQPPWETPAGKPEPQVEATSVNKEGGFPVIIFVVIVLAILIAIGIFLWVQEALPF
jgi:hypothetical protein